MLNHFVYANIKLHILLIKSLTIATAGKFDETLFQVFSSIVRFAGAVEVYAVRAKINFLPFRQFEVEFTNLRLFLTFNRFLLNFANFNRLSYFKAMFVSILLDNQSISINGVSLKIVIFLFSQVGDVCD